MNSHQREILEAEAAFIASVIAAELPDVDPQTVRDAAYTALVALESGTVAAKLFLEYHQRRSTDRPRLLASFRRLLHFFPPAHRLMRSCLGWVGGRATW